ncbi:MAG: helix-turn-helix domain-containing protein, partial [Sulfuricurvum sp.]|nr:helix-turn-helix domain-containing protein [Sulfuricurvum sp.]
NDGMIMYNGEMLLLSHYERIVLGLLIKNFRCVVSRETFFEHLWNCPDDINEGTLRNTILKLRKKLNIEIENVRNVGYIFTKYL